MMINNGILDCTVDGHPIQDMGMSSFPADNQTLSTKNWDLTFKNS